MSGSKLIVDSVLRAAVNLRSSKIPSEVARSSAALFSVYGGAKQTLPSLSYDYGALERKLENSARNHVFIWVPFSLPFFSP
jgi:hypothetical protein